MKLVSSALPRLCVVLRGKIRTRHCSSSYWVKTTPSAKPASYKPTLAWVEYRDEAARFVATNADAAQRL